MFFLELSCLLDDPTDVGNLISGSSAFSKSSLNISKLSVHILLKPLLGNFEQYFASVWDESIYSTLNILWHCLSLGLEWKLTFTNAECGHCCVFQICWHIECTTFTASSFRIWNSLTGIPSPPLALFEVMLPKAHLTSHSRISGSSWVWVVIPSWLSGSWRSFLYSSSLYSYPLFLIYCASVRSIPFLSFIVTSFAWNIPLVSLIFLKRSPVFPILLFSSISLHWSPRKAFSLLFSGTLHSNVYIFPFLFAFYFSSFHSYF